MKLYLLIISAFFIIIITVVGWQHSIPAIICRNPRLNLGEIKQGQIARAGFTIENSSDFDVNIKQIERSCACVAVWHSSDTIKAHSSQEVFLSIDTKNRSAFAGGTAALSFDKCFLGKIKPLVLDFSFTIVNAVILSRQIIDLATIKPTDEPTVVEVTAFIPPDEINSIEFIQVVNHSNFIKVESISGALKGYKKFKIIVDPAHCPIGYNCAEIEFKPILKMNQKWESPLVKVYTNILGKLRANPSALYGKLMNGKPLVETVCIQSKNLDLNNTNLKIRLNQCGDARVILKKISSKEDELQFSVTSTKPLDHINGNIVVFDPRGKDCFVKIPVVMY